MKPTNEQQAIIDAARSPASLMVNALAGTGKTTTLTMLAQALPKEPTLALAFNKKIKEELEKRFPPHFTVMTLNGLGHRAWSFTINKKQMLLDDKKVSKLTTEALKNFPESKGAWAQIRSAVVHAMGLGLVPSKFEHAKGFIADTPDNWSQINDEYDLGLSAGELKLARAVLIESIEAGFKGHISFDDQIYLPTIFNGSFPRFPVVMVDEAQDLSPLNHAMLRKVSAGRLIVVGDPRQAIYAFRGADTASMAKIRALKTDWIELPLNTTFRCPQLVVERQWDHAPDYVAAPSNPKGVVKDWQGTPWNWDNLPYDDVAILCRNNAPLLTMAFKLLRNNIGVTMLGRDIGRGLTRLIKTIEPDQSAPTKAFVGRLAAWKEAEFSKAQANDDSTKMESVMDKFECIMAVVQNNTLATVADVQKALEALFASDSGLVTLATGHKSKGLEWSTVIHLDPWRIPSKFAKTPSELEQENNLRYVLETRTKHTLILANAKDFEP